MGKIPKKLEPKPVKKTGKLPAKEKADKTEEEEEEEEEDSPQRLSSDEDKAEEKQPEETDYLRQYQYKKVNNVPQLGGVLTDPDKGSKAERMKEFLLSEPKVYMMIPAEQGTDPKIPYSSLRNGYRLDFPTNSYIHIPREIAKDIVAANKQTLEALSRDRVETNQKQGAESALNI